MSGVNVTLTFPSEYRTFIILNNENNGILSSKTFFEFKKSPKYGKPEASSSFLFQLKKDHMFMLMSFSFEKFITIDSEFNVIPDNNYSRIFGVIYERVFLPLKGLDFACESFQCNLTQLAISIKGIEIK